MVSELIPAGRRRVGAAPPARPATAPLDALHLISLLGDDVTPGRLVRREAIGDDCGDVGMETVCATSDFTVRRLFSACRPVARRSH